MGFMEVRQTALSGNDKQGLSVCYVYADSPTEWLT